MSARYYTEPGVGLVHSLSSRESCDDPACPAKKHIRLTVIVGDGHELSGARLGGAPVWRDDEPCEEVAG